MNHTVIQVSTVYKILQLFTPNINLKIESLRQTSKSFSNFTFTAAALVKHSSFTFNSKIKAHGIYDYVNGPLTWYSILHMT